MIKDKITKVVQKVSGEKEIHLGVPELEEHGDYATNVAMVLAKKKKKNPRDLAEEIIKKLRGNKDLAKVVSKIEVAGPGFVNFWLKEEYLLGNLKDIQKEKEKYGSGTIGKDQKVIVEYSSPNIAKQFSVGHLRSTIIGQALYNLYKFLGYKVVGENHLGDWGTQFGMIIAQVVRKNKDPNKLSVDDFEKLYVEFNREAEKDPKVRDEGKLWFKKLEEGDKKARKIWKKAKVVSLREFEKIYTLLDVKVDNQHGESFYEDKMSKVIDQARKRGLSKKSKGAEIVELKREPPAMLLKSDGATTYFTRDLATIKYRIDTWDPNIFIYEVGSEQKLHFRQVFSTAKLLGWGKGREFVHVAHGLFLFGGKKMSTRKGTGIKLEEVLKESVKKARKIIDKSETGRGLSEEEKVSVAKEVGTGAIKYFDLSHRPTSDINFDWKTTLALEGNSGPYLQYTVARTNSVLAKLKTDNSKLKASIKNLKLNREELSVLRSLSRFSEVIIDASKSYSPNLLANYLFDLAQKYNTFYNKHKIILSKEAIFRLALTSATGQVLKNGLKLLGIKAPERM